MPIYEYQCSNCGKIEEALQKFSDPPLTRCSHCSGQLHKLISQSSFHLKGSGWYVTDYAGKSNNAASAKTDKTPPQTPKTEPKATSGVEKKTPE